MKLQIYKLFPLFWVILITLSTSNGHAQEYRAKGRFCAFFPSHPLMEKQVYIRIMADSLVRKTFNETGEALGENNDYHFRVKRSVDHLTDTVIYGFVSMAPAVVEKYDPENKLLSELYFDEVKSYLAYTYDKKNRVKTKAFYSFENYDNTLAVTTFTYYDDQVLKTDSGYFHTIIRFFLSNDGFTRADTTTTEYVFNQQKQLIRAGDERYTYLEDGGIVSTTINNQEKRKYEYLHDSNGLRKQNKIYTWKNDKWELEEYTLVTYYKKGLPLSNEPIVEPKVIQVYGIRGGVIINTEDQQPLQIYSITGQLVKQLQPQPNEYIPLPRGLYIVKIKNQVQKVYVR